MACWRCSRYGFENDTLSRRRFGGWPAENAATFGRLRAAAARACPNVTSVKPGWDFACPDWAARLREGRGLIPALPLDRAAAERSVKIYNMLHLPDVVGQPALGEAGGEWQRDIVRAVFGSIDPADGARMVPEIFAMVPKKNNKTTGGAAMMLTALLMNERPRAEFVLIGPTQEVADVAFQQAQGMIDADPAGYLQKLFHVQNHLKRITNRRTKAFLKIKTFDMNVMVGSKPVGVLVDELHVMSSMSYASRVIGQIRGGLMPNPEAFLIFITTQSDQAPAGVFKAELNHARAIRDGTAKGRMLPLLYEFPREIQKSDLWRDPAIWPQVIPNLGLSITLDRLISDFEGARAKGLEEERRWASQHLNIEIGIALHSDQWAGVAHWEACGDPTLTLDELILRSEIAVVGIDGGGLDDLLGLAVIGRCRETGRWLLWTHAWAHRSVLDRRKDIAERLLDFQKDGDLTIVDAVGDDVVQVGDCVERLEMAGLLPAKLAIGVDQAGIDAIIDELFQRGIVEARFIPVPQGGWKLNNAIKTAERKVASGQFVHGASGMMAWTISNVKIVPKGNSLSADKQVSGSAKIDAFLAFLDAVVVMGQNPEAGPSVYEQEDVVV